MHVPAVDFQTQYQTIKPEVDAAIDAVVRSGRFIQGEIVEEFSSYWSAYCGGCYTIPCNSGTDAVLLAILGVLGRGDGTKDIILPSLTYVATAEAILNAGYRPVFVDVDPKTCLINLACVEREITVRTVAVIPVHLYGQMVDVKAVADIAAGYKIPVIEDAAQAHGATFAGLVPGQLSRVAAWSYYPSKNLGAMGDAGAVTTWDPELALKLTALANHGQAGLNNHRLVGMNSRMDSIQAAVLLVKLKYLDQWNTQRRINAEMYNEWLRPYERYTLPYTHSSAVHVYHQYTIQTDQRDELLNYLWTNNVDARVYYATPTHQQPAYQRYAAERELPETERMCQRILSLPVQPELTYEQQKYVVELLRKFPG